MKKFLFTALFGLLTFGSYADENSDEILKLQIDARLDYQRDWIDGETVKDNTGFEGKYINIRIDGSIVPGLTFSWRQRLNKTHIDKSFFDATDWLYLNYDIHKWSIAGGKEIVCIGGWEYDRAPIDLYGCSVFWNNIPCYQIGASVGFKVTNQDKLTFQFCESPFFTSENRDMYGYSLMWNGSHGFFSSIYSINLFEYAPGRFINYLALGNRFSFGKCYLELDLMNRAAGHQKFLFKDNSIMGEIGYMPNEKWKIHAKMTYDINKSGTDADLCVLDGTDLKMIGGGVEFFPLLKKKTSLRLHANFYYSWGHNTNTGDVMQNKTSLLAVGIKWNMDLLSLKRK